MKRTSKRILSVLIALVMVVALLPTAAFADSSTTETLNLTVGAYGKKSVKKIDSFDTAYEYYTNGNPNGKPPVKWSYDEGDVAYIQLNNQTSATFEFETAGDNSEEEKAFEVTHDTCIVLREAVALQPDAVKEVTVTVKTPIVVKSGHYLILRSQGTGYSNEYTTVKLNSPITVEEGATLLLDGPTFSGNPTGPRDIYIGPESGPAIIAKEGATVRLGGVVLQPNASNEDAFIQAKGATVIVQAGNTTDTAKGQSATGALPDVNETYYHSNTYAETSGSAPIIEASEDATVQLLGGNLVSTGDTPAITVDGSSSIQIDMEDAAWTNKHGQGVAADGTAAISVASGGTLELGEYAPATASDNETQAIELAAGVTVKKGGIEITVSEENDDVGDNYVDNYGNIILAAKSNEDGTVSAKKVILDDGTTIEGSEKEPLQITYEDDEETSETVTKVTVPANGTVQEPGEDEATVLPGGGTVDGDSNNITVNVAGVTLNSEKLSISKGDTATLTATVSPEDATNKTVTWSSSDENVATVENGTVTAVGYGKATITATVGGKTATCTVFVPHPYSPPANPNPSYSVSVPSVSNGTLNVTPSNASKNTTVTITATPDEGYVLDSLIVFDATNKVPVTQVGENKFTFTMPGSAVSVQAEFRRIPDAWTNPYTDVAESAWYYDAVKYAAEHGLMGGNGDGTFAPTDPTNRSMIATILYRLEGQPAVSGNSGFSDVADGAWYADAVAWAVANNIMGGYGDGRFGSNDPITRQDLAVTLLRYAKYKGYDVTAQADLSGYTDASEISGYAVEAMRWANAEALINGAGTLIAPKGDAQRAMVAAILMRFCENVAK